MTAQEVCELIVEVKLDELLASIMCQHNGYDMFVARRDKEVFTRIMLLMPDLVTVEVDNGLITSATHEN